MLTLPRYLTADRPRPSETPDPPSPPSALRALVGFARDPLHFALQLTRDHGDVIRLGFGGYYLISHPRDVRHVLQDNHGNYWKGRTLHRRSGGLFGRGLVVSEGAEWRRQRRTLQPALSPKALPRYVQVMVRETVRTIDRWQRQAHAGGSLDVKAELRVLTQDIITAAMFQSEVGARTAPMSAAMTDLGVYVDRSMRAPVFVPPSVPTPGNLRFRRAVRTIDQTVMGFVEERRASGELGDDLLSLLLQSRDEETGAGMSARQIRDELVTIFVAGHETVTNTLSWALFLLSKHPEAQRRLADEVATVLGGREPDVGDLPRLTYTERFIQEVLRLYPPAWVLIREPFEDDEIGGFRVPARASLLVSPYVTHHRADVWENPEGFDPDRFAPEQVAGRDRFAWIPFGGGPRVCLGQAFAMAEMKIALALITQRLPLELVPGPPVVPEPRLTLEPSGLRMVPVSRTWDRDRVHPKIAV